MKKVIYYVATSIDGFIATKEDEISGFVHDEKFVSYYYEQLNQFNTVIMGKNTYEFGYQFGLKPGEKAYQHMDHYIFSKSIELPAESKVYKVTDEWTNKVKELKKSSSSDIYLCGGSQFAGFLAKEHLIDQVWIKLNPFLMGAGKPLFQGEQSFNLELYNLEKFDCGVSEHRYNVVRNNQ